MKNAILFDRLVEIAKIQSTEASNKIEGIVPTSIRMIWTDGIVAGRKRLQGIG